MARNEAPVHPEDRLRTRNELLQVWQRWVRTAENWGDARNPNRNSIMDAELLECVLLPQFLIDELSLETFPRAADDVCEVLNQLRSQQIGDTFSGALDISVHEFLRSRIHNFLEFHRDSHGRPTFTPGGYVEAKPEDIDKCPPIVDSFTLSASVCAQTLYLFDRWLDNAGDSEKHRTFIDSLGVTRDLCSERLTGSLLGLARSFAISLMTVEEWENKTGRSWPQGHPDIEAVRRRMINDDLTGKAITAEAKRQKLDLNEDFAFECGWSWGQTRYGKDWYQDIDNKEPDAAYVAEAAPYLYFTINAMDGISDIESQKVRGSGLLNREQAILQGRLSFYLETTSLYWSALAFGEQSEFAGRWAIEDIPWTTADGSVSDYWTLYMLTVATSSRAGLSQFAEEEKLDRLLYLVDELAQRGRLTRRPAGKDDPALGLHLPAGQGLASEQQLKLHFDPEAGVNAVYEWAIYDYAPKLLKLCGRVLGLVKTRETRERARELIDDIWSQHLARRRYAPNLGDGFAWDDVQAAWNLSLPEVAADNTGAIHTNINSEYVSSWYITERVVEALCTVLDADSKRVSSGDTVRKLASEIVDELRWRLTTYDRSSGPQVELVNGWMTELEEARALLEVSPAAALSILLSIAADMKPEN